MIAVIVAAMTARMQAMEDEKIQRLKKKKLQEENLKKAKAKIKNTSRGVGKYMGKNSNHLNIDNF